MLERLPQRFLNAQTARAITAPSAIVLGGAGAALAILASAPIAAVIGVGALAWAARVAMGLPRGPRGERVDPFTLAEPWRQAVIDAGVAQRRFESAVKGAKVGPLRDRLQEIAGRLAEGVKECWTIAQHGHLLAKGLTVLDVQATQRSLIDVERDLAKTPDPRLEQTRESLRAQLHAAQRMIDAVQDARTQLRLLDARLDEAVTRAIELTVRPDGHDDVAGLGSDVDTLVSDMEALRAALEDVDATRPSAGGTTATA